jgi:hypothetical protein
MNETRRLPNTFLDIGLGKYRTGYFNKVYGNFAIHVGFGIGIPRADSPHCEDPKPSRLHRDLQSQERSRKLIPYSNRAA